MKSEYCPQARWEPLSFLYKDMEWPSKECTQPPFYVKREAHGP